MFGLRYSPDAAYLRSQATVTIPFRPSAVARGITLRLVGASDDHRERRRLGQLLIEALNGDAGLTRCQLTVADRPQVHHHDGQRLQSKTYGYYNCKFDDGAVTTARIRIYHRTAVRQQVIAPKVFLNTLLHEWMHHFDFAGLGLSRSPHTAGFYTRLRALAEALDVAFVLPPDPDAGVSGSGVTASRAADSTGGRAAQRLPGW
jgi:hypothetical protein